MVDSAMKRDCTPKCNIAATRSPMQRRDFLRCGASIGLMLPLTAATAATSAAEPEILLAKNQVAKVAVDRTMGAAITWLSWKAYAHNSVNIHDPGRLIQQSYYAGKSLDHARLTPRATRWVFCPPSVGSALRVTVPCAGCDEF